MTRPRAVQFLTKQDTWYLGVQKTLWGINWSHSRSYITNNNIILKRLKHCSRFPTSRPPQLLSTYHTWAAKFTPSLYPGSQEVMHAHPWEADCIDAFLSVKCSHFFQGFQPRCHFEIVVITQPVCEFLLPPLFLNVFLHLWNSLRVSTYSSFKHEYHAG